MATLKNACVIIMLLVITSFTLPHHGWADYDQEKTLDYTGTIQELVYENPHATIRITDAKKIWSVYLAPVSRMQARGVTEEMVKKGSTIRVVGYPHKKVKDEMRAERIFVDGNKYELR
jgi:hypothetical protein